MARILVLGRYPSEGAALSRLQGEHDARSGVIRDGILDDIDARANEFDIIIIDVTPNDPVEWNLVDDLRRAMVLKRPAPVILCVSRSRYGGTAVRLDAERRGVRFAYADRLECVLDEIDLILLEAKRLASTGPSFLIVHRYSTPGTICLPGEEVSVVLLSSRCQTIPLPFSLATRILFNQIASCRLPQSASQIEASIKVDEFYTRHAANAQTKSRQTRSFSRPAVKEYVKRIRQIMASTLPAVGINMDPCEILRSERTTGNEVLYRLQANVRIIHTR